MPIKSKMITVPSKITLNYHDVNGEPVECLMFSNAEYRVTLNNGVDYYIQPKQVIKDEDAETYSLYPSFELIPGKSNVIKECKWSIPVEAIVDVKRVSSVYEKCKERFSDFRDNNLRIFTFVFNSYTRPETYKIAVNEGNFLCLSLTSGGRNGRRNVYGYIEDVKDDDTIVFKRYISVKGNRSIHEELIPIDQLGAIYRYQLSIKDYEEPEPDTTATTDSVSENVSVNAEAQDNNVG